MSRRDFLRLSGIGLAGAFLLATAGVGDALAQQSASVLEAEFEEAATEYGVPKELLLAMGYVNTRWEMPPPGSNEYEPGNPHGWGSYGIMALIQNPSSDTLGEASRLTGIPEETLKTDRRSNIRGGAALLAESQGAKPTRLGDWFGAVDGRGGNGRVLEATAGVGGGELYAQQTSEVLTSGASASIASGESIHLPPQSLAARVTARGATTLPRGATTLPWGKAF
jgi:hypothetical protein